MFAYDNSGNIITKKETEFTLKENTEDCLFTEHLYEYDGDRLVYYKGKTCSYGATGKPSIYKNNNVYWSGVNVVEYGNNTFTYDARGRRLTKNNLVYTYDGNGKLIRQSNGLEFFYDHTGVAGMKYNGSTYIYRKDVQGNIIALLDSSGTVVVKYTYDAWGNYAAEALDYYDGKVQFKNVDSDKAFNADYEKYKQLANINPFRYRGYYYDTETELYFLKTRYYDPEVGRFISPDSIEYLDPETINGLNLYAYCNDNPVSNVDPNGNKWWNILAWIGVGLVVAAITVLTAGMAGAVISGVAGGIIYGAAIGTLALGSIGAVGGAVGGIIYDGVNGNSFGTSIWTWTKAGFGIGAIAGAIIGGAIGGAAAASVTGLTNTSFWTGLGENGAKIAANAAKEKGLTTIGQTFGGKLVQRLTDIFGYKATHFLWVSLSKTMASTVAMKSVTVFTGLTIGAKSVFTLFEKPELVKRGIEIIRIILGE